MKRTLIICSVLAIAGCGRMVDGTKDALNKGGELAGSAATEVIEGVATGVEDTWSINVVLSDDLMDKMVMRRRSGFGDRRIGFVRHSVAVGQQ